LILTVVPESTSITPPPQIYLLVVWEISYKKYGQYPTDKRKYKFIIRLSNSQKRKGYGLALLLYGCLVAAPPAESGGRPSGKLGPITLC